MHDVIDRPAGALAERVGAASGASRRCAKFGARSPSAVPAGAGSWPSWGRATSSPSATWTPATGRPRSPAARVRLRAALGRASVEPHGDPAAGAVRAPRLRNRARSGAGLPRLVFQARGLSCSGSWPRSRFAPPTSPRSSAPPSASTAVRHPARVGVFITALDVFLILYLQSLGFRWIEAFVVTTLRRHRRVLRHPGGHGAARHARGDPRFHSDGRDREQPGDALSRMGILGATVMPHNLYLHSVDRADAHLRPTRSRPSARRSNSRPSIPRSR